MYKDLAEVTIRTYDVSLGAAVGSLADVGYCDEPEVVTALKLTTLMVNQLGAQRLGDRVVGADVTLKFKLRQFSADNLKLALPWGSGTSWGLAPATIGVDLYSYAKVWRFHPRDLTANDHTQDITLLKGVPVMGLNHKGDGEKDSSIAFEIAAYPVRTSLPTINLGYLGADPA